MMKHMSYVRISPIIKYFKRYISHRTKYSCLRENVRLLFEFIIPSLREYHTIQFLNHTLPYYFLKYTIHFLNSRYISMLL